MDEQKLLTLAEASELSIKKEIMVTGVIVPPQLFAELLASGFFENLTKRQQEILMSTSRAICGPYDESQVLK